jgi:hypothetical protein
VPVLWDELYRRQQLRSGGQHRAWCCVSDAGADSRADTCTDTGTNTRADTCADAGANSRADSCTDTFADSCADSCTNTFADPCADPFSNTPDPCADTCAYPFGGLAVQLLRGVCPVCHGNAQMPILWDKLYRRQHMR